MISIRGAITVDENTEESIIEATKEMMKKIQDKNNFSKDDVVSMVFTTTKDLNQVAPSKACRELGYVNAGLLNFNEIDIEDSLEMCIRGLIFINSNLKQSDAKHVYLRDARKLRPDLI